MKKFFVFTFLLFFPSLASAHEAYVLPKDFFWGSLEAPWSFHAFAALTNPANVRTFAIVTAAVLVLLLANFLFRLTPPGRALHASLEKLARFGPQFVRFSAAGALFFSAASGSLLGPELPLASLAHPVFARAALYAASFMIASGFLTELAAVLCLAVFAEGFAAFGSYIFTYLNYLGEFLVLLLFGMRVFSLDRLLFGPLRRLRVFEKYETAIVRVLYGAALTYAAVTVKLLHPALTEHVVTEWHLNQFHWLFPSDPLLVTFGAGLAELAIGLFILIGFEVRLTVLVSLFYITLSLLYFRELVWPHYLLYGISLNLLVQPEILTLDHLVFGRLRRRRRWWLRPFLPHNEHGKSAGS